MAIQAAANKYHNNAILFGAEVLATRITSRAPDGTAIKVQDWPTTTKSCRRGRGSLMCRRQSSFTTPCSAGLFELRLLVASLRPSIT